MMMVSMRIAMMSLHTQSHNDLDIDDYNEKPKNYCYRKIWLIVHPNIPAGAPFPDVVQRLPDFTRIQIISIKLNIVYQTEEIILIPSSTFQQGRHQGGRVERTVVSLAA